MSPSIKFSIFTILIFSLFSSSLSQSTTGANPLYPGLDTSGANAYPQAPFYASFCDRYTTKLGLDYTNPAHQWQVMLWVADRAYAGVDQNTNVYPPAFVSVPGLINNLNTLPFFNGQIQSRFAGGPLAPPTPNFQNDTAALNILGSHIAELFGIAFGCSSQNYTLNYAYSGVSDLTALHSGMGITQVIMTAFINQFALACQSIGVTDYDFQNTVVPYLQSFGRGAPSGRTICTDSSCDCATGYGGTNCATLLSSTGPTVVLVQSSTGGNDAASSHPCLWLAVMALLAVIVQQYTF